MSVLVLLVLLWSKYPALQYSRATVTRLTVGLRAPQLWEEWDRNTGEDRLLRSTVRSSGTLDPCPGLLAWTRLGEGGVSHQRLIIVLLSVQVLLSVDQARPPPSTTTFSSNWVKADTETISRAAVQSSLEQHANMQWINQPGARCTLRHKNCYIFQKIPAQVGIGGFFITITRSVLFC